MYDLVLSVTRCMCLCKFAYFKMRFDYNINYEEIRVFRYTEMSYFVLRRLNPVVPVVMTALTVICLLGYNSIVLIVL